MKLRLTSLSNIAKILRKRTKFVAATLFVVAFTSAAAFAITYSNSSQPHVQDTTSDAQSTQTQTKAVATSNDEKPSKKPQTQEPSDNTSTANNPNTAIPSSSMPRDVQDNSTEFPKAKVPKMSIGSISKPTYKYIYFQTNGFSAKNYLFVITPVKTAKPVNTYITQNYIEEQAPSGTPVSQTGRGNPDFIPNMSVGDEFKIAICDEAGYLQCGSVMSDKLRLVVTHMQYHSGSGYDYVYEYK